MIIDQFSLTDQVALVTGAGRGLGRGIALGFAQAGAHLVLLSRTAAEIEAVAEEVRRLGRRALPLRADVRVAEQVEAAVRRAEEELGRIDILMNNAGGAFPGRIVDMGEELWDEMLRWNLKPIFLCCRAVGRVMMKQGRGAIINMSSLAGSAATPQLGPYAASKAAAINLTRTLAHELAPHGIRVNAIAPGKILTSHTSTAALWTTPELRAEAARDIALGRLGTPEDVAPVAVFLASRASAYITGQTIAIDGGWGALRLLDSLDPPQAQAAPPAPVPAPRAPDLAETQDRLLSWLKGKLGPDLSLSPLRRTPAGFSNETFFLDLTVREGGGPRREQLVVRWLPRERQVFPDYDLRRQYEVMRCLLHSGIPVPRVRWLEEDPAVLGSPFYIMDRIDGVAASEVPPYHSFGLCLDATPEARAKMWWGCLTTVARINALDWQALGLGFLGVPGGGTDPLDKQIDYYERFLEWSREEPQPILSEALSWLRRNRFTPRRVALCWGDCRVPNLLYRDYEVVGVLDWEMAHLGDPESDLGWLLFLDWQHSEGFGIPRLPGFPSREETVRRYEELSGAPVENLFFHEVLAACKFGVILAQIARTMKATGVPAPTPDFATNNPATQRLASLLGLPPPGGQRPVTHLDKVSIRVQFHLTGPGGSDWYLEVVDGVGSRHEGVAQDAGATMTVAASDWAAIQSGELDRMNAFMGGKLKIEGDVTLLMQLEDQITRLSRPAR